MVGVVDRLDRTPKGLTITDYKTGRYISKVQREGKLLLEIQLPLYLSIERAEVLGEAGPEGAKK